jgi:hypothetical protein
MKISGKVVYLDIGTGAYGIVDDTGRKFLPVKMPIQLRKDGASVTCDVRPVDVVSMIMWGEPVEIYAFETLQV